MGASFSSFETTHCLIDRKTGQRVPEPTPFTFSLRTALLYNTWFGRFLLKLPITWWLLTLQHKRIAKFANSPKSKSKIKSLIRSYCIGTEDSARPVEDFKTLQEFFTRKLKPGARPIAEPGNPNEAVHPADSRVVVFPSVSSAKKLCLE
ncbi:phosphatidylserine decarboxylase [Monoraphidium neglectum]|uniref:Phosphatidylserine decarboxylase n=1 Tax=Monoraphidium neglectum TaxID=145388 RepID=A0A0D2M387_9CHLO|nr:phosphatidylserine decarboxylase [Monoraphidium neglectum]KIY95811.1 phosphatidylserine decarboxylase [Monoraphidium neglectum]|eukprot:XP_013894831.1 phosphatidylserine decarboxylase [Monoraphidium neglectum]